MAATELVAPRSGARLFALRPHKRIELEKKLGYSDVLTEEGQYELWADLDCTGMDKIVPQAFSALAHSNRAGFVFSKKGK